MSRSVVLIAVGAFVAVFALHFGLLTWQQARVAAQWVRVGSPSDVSAWARYLERGDFWFGYSYALAAGFTGFAVALTVRRRRRAGAGVVGGMTFMGALYAGGCFLIGCCGSPMLAVYLSVFGASILGFLKPIVATVTTLSVVLGVILILRRSRGSEGAACSACDSTPVRPRA